VRLKKSRNILRNAFKTEKEDGFDQVWQKQLLMPLLKKNSFDVESLGKAFHEFRDDADIHTLKTSYEKGMARLRHLVMEETYGRA